jgi:hypothetical protein
MMTPVQIGFLVAVLIGLWLLARLLGIGDPPAEKGKPAAPVLQLPGDGEFETEVVGESHYQDALAKIAGPKTSAGVDLAVRARLVPEPDNPHDSNAVAIYVQGLKVGHLPRDMAAEWVETLRRRGDARAVIEVDANITGGWLRKRRDGKISEGSFGVSLDIFDELDD